MQTVACGYLARVDLVSAGFDVNGNEVVVVFLLQVRADVLLKMASPRLANSSLLQRGLIAAMASLLKTGGEPLWLYYTLLASQTKPCVEHYRTARTGSPCLLGLAGSFEIRNERKKPRIVEPVVSRAEKG